MDYEKRNKQIPGLELWPILNGADAPLCDGWYNRAAAMQR